MRPLYDLASVFSDQIRTAELEAGRIYDPVIGIVTDNKDPTKLARVKVKIPILSDRDSTWWAPIAMLGAGKNRGWFFIPEIDDEVLIMFEHGDPDRPIVVGALWNGKDKPPDRNSDGNPRRMITSRQGSRIVFDDDTEQLIIEDGANKGRIVLDAKANKITIEALDGDVCLQAPNGDLQIVAKQIELTARDKLEIHAGSSMAWGTDASAEINGSSSVTMAGARVNLNCGNAKAPPAPTSDPQDVKDPYGS
ncbi:MAG: phage baseplate assembly protein V [Kofleriaceae bacterium]